mmetsp:Transcript_2336/g.6110  ORF Transcript_2336/g.6110 Transcript_2336/m.6110 type:complete len:210 (+) Transcript_2336:1948-2577(+)
MLVVIVVDVDVIRFTFIVVGVVSSIDVVLDVVFSLGPILDFISFGVDHSIFVGVIRCVFSGGVGFFVEYIAFSFRCILGHVRLLLLEHQALLLMLESLGASLVRGESRNAATVHFGIALLLALPISKVNNIHDSGFDQVSHITVTSNGLVRFVLDRELLRFGLGGRVLVRLLLCFVVVFWCGVLCNFGSCVACRLIGFGVNRRSFFSGV